ncbi:MAG TPA: hypothetical protein VK202_08690, partial [Bacteroidia bacterium]|nr:hypothetical protein [Bacteroidia bacterium]
NFSYTIPTYKTDLSVFYKFNGKQLAYGLDANAQVQENFIQSFHMLDANLSRKIFKGKCYVALGCKNILQVVNLNSNLVSGVHSVSSGQLLMGTGRSYFASVKWYVGGKS